MKKLLSILILFALLVSLFTACSSSGGDYDEAPSDLEVFDALMQEMTSLTEYHFTANMTLNFAHPDHIPMGFQVEGSVSHQNGEMIAIFSYQTEDGTPLAVPDLEVILCDSGTMYLGLVPILEHALRPTIESFGLDMADFQAQDILGDYEYLMSPYEEPFSSMIFAPINIGSGIDLDPFLTRNEDRFTITMENEDIRSLASDLGRALDQFTTQGNDELGDMIGSVSQLLAQADLSGAQVSLVYNQIGDTFHQSIQLHVANFIDLQANFSFTEAYIPPVGTISNALTQAAFADIFVAIDIFAIMGSMIREPVEGEIRYEEDLYDLNLLSPALADESLLTTAALISEDGDSHTVAVIDGSAISEEPGVLEQDADAIGMTYTIFTDQNAFDAVLTAAQTDREEVFLPDSTFSFSALRTNEGRSMAVMAIAEETEAGMQRVHVYLAQNTLDLDGIHLAIVLYPGLFTDTDHEILAALSEQFGIDFSAYITELLGLS